MKLQQFERLNYSEGLLLTAESLRLEQEYHRNKARLRNQFLHGWGIVAGLRAVLDESNVVISPGLALDCCGNELVLARATAVPLPSMTGRYWLTIRYFEQLAGEVPSGSDVTTLSLVKEGVLLELSSHNPMDSHDRRRSARVGCGESHALPIAVVSRRASRWSITHLRSSMLRTTVS